MVHKEKQVMVATVAHTSAFDDRTVHFSRCLNRVWDEVVNDQKQMKNISSFANKYSKFSDKSGNVESGFHRQPILRKQNRSGSR